MPETSPIQHLLKIMEDLRDPENGCQWNKNQTFETIAQYTIEEAYEVVEAIKQKNHKSLKDELGDLLFQVVFYAQMSKEIGEFNFNDIVETIIQKMIRRHPNVFSFGPNIGFEDQTIVWENQKAKERLSRNNQSGVLSGVALALPALIRAQKLQKRAARVGFDWDAIEPVIAKIKEEIEEVKEALDDPENSNRIQEEIGDLLFSCVNLARHSRVDAEQALMAGNEKFERRFRGIEQKLRAKEKSIEDCSLEELENYWNAVKSREKF